MAFGEQRMIYSVREQNSDLKAAEVFTIAPKRPMAVKGGELHVW